MLHWRLRWSRIHIIAQVCAKVNTHSVPTTTNTSSVQVKTIISPAVTCRLAQASVFRSHQLRCLYGGNPFCGAEVRHDRHPPRPIELVIQSDYWETKRPTGWWGDNESASINLWLLSLLSRSNQVNLDTVFYVVAPRGYNAEYCVGDRSGHCPGSCSRKGKAPACDHSGGRRGGHSRSRRECAHARSFSRTSRYTNSRALRA